MNEQVYTDVKGDYNIKIRLIRCPYCLNEVESNLPAPKCEFCKSYMLTVLEPKDESSAS